MDQGSAFTIICTGIGTVVSMVGFVYLFFRNFKSDIEKRFDKIDKSFDKIDEKFDKIESELKDSNTRVSRIEGFLMGPVQMNGTENKEKK